MKEPRNRSGPTTTSRLRLPRGRRRRVRGAPRTFAGERRHGSNRWPAVHRFDAARLFRLALEKAPTGQALHGVGEGAVPFKSIAEKIGDGVRVPVTSVAPEQAAGHFANPFIALVYGTDAPASSTFTQSLLGWTPTHVTLLEDLETGDYFARQDRRRLDAPYGGEG